jgi:RNA polymerase subunit RPABC4/transcription elongation factor Spt4
MDFLLKIFDYPSLRVWMRLFSLFMFVFWLSLVYRTYKDAQKRGAMALYWAFVVFLFNVFGWAIYLMVRPPEYLIDVKERELEIKEKEVLLQREGMFCPGCNKAIGNDYLACPYCLKELKQACPRCGRAVDVNWRVCPYCKSAIHKKAKA